MRTLMLVLLFVGILHAPLHAAEFAKCDLDDAENVREHPSPRVRELFAQLLRKAGQRPEKFALCEGWPIIPQIALVQTRSGQRVHEVAFPWYVSWYSDDEILGIFAHELGHLPIHGAAIGAMRAEKAADSRGARWVGARMVASGLRALQRDVHSKMPSHVHAATFKELDVRARRLEKQR
ncbi:MAG: hypothetical protein KBD06_02060 [Candidatus Pacebacteria bacterium]|nr:hypothetical protein [Candidatus Paceibacterota bacterium]